MFVSLVLTEFGIHSLRESNLVFFWSDESHILSSSGRVFVWRTPSQAYTVDYLRPIVIIITTWCRRRIIAAYARNQYLGNKL